jgi:hypothetical protein
MKLGYTHLNLVFAPPQHPRKVGQTKSLQAEQDIFPPPFAQSFHFAVSRPRIDGHLEYLLLDVHKPCLDIPLLQAVGNAEGPICLRRHSSVVHAPVPIEDRPIVRHSAIITAGHAHDLLALHPPTGLGVVEALRNDIAKVGETAQQNTGVDVVVVICWHAPVLLLSIVDDKMHVFWNGRRLDGREVGRLDGCFWVQVTHLDCPDACAGADIENIFGAFEGGKVQASTEGLVQDAVLKV